MAELNREKIWQIKARTLRKLDEFENANLLNHAQIVERHWRQLTFLLDLGITDLEPLQKNLSGKKIILVESIPAQENNRYWEKYLCIKINSFQTVPSDLNRLMEEFCIDGAIVHVHDGEEAAVIDAFKSGNKILAITTSYRQSSQASASLAKAGVPTMEKDKVEGSFMEEAFVRFSQLFD